MLYARDVKWFRNFCTSARFTTIGARFTTIGARFIVGGCFAGMSAHADLNRTYRHAQPLPDAVFLQEIGEQILSPQPIRAVAITRDGVLWSGTDEGLSRREGTNWVPVTEVQSAIRRLVVIEGELWALSGTGARRQDAGRWTPVGSGKVVDVCGHRGEVIAATERRLFRVRGTSLEPLGEKDCRFPVTRIVTHTDVLHVHGVGRLTVFTQAKFGGLDLYGFEADQAWDWGSLPSPRTRDVLSMGNRLIVATDRGLGVLRGMSLTTLRGSDGLPYEDTLCLAAGFTNDVWIGTSRGAIRMVGDTWHYFSGQRWLPAEAVNAIAVGDQLVALATDRGLGLIRYEPYTLAKKAAYYERHLEEWGQKRLGLTHKLEWDEPRKEYVREVGDNDGGYTGDYLAAQSYRYAVTQDPAARREATNTFHALRWLEAMTGIPGFPARAVWAKGEVGHKSTGGSGGYPAEWHDTADGRFEWKGDTSSDELCSHYYAVGLFLELVAQGDEVRQAKTHLARIADHLIQHGWQLVDFDGKPTRWGRWDPDYFSTDEGRYDRGLQCVELLSFIRTAATVTGEKRFENAYQKLVSLGYPEHTLRQRNTSPPESVLHFLDELAFWGYWNLLRYEPNPELRGLYRRSMERTYEVVRVEQHPWLNFVYAALTGETGELAPSIRHLREWPLDLRVWSYQNSHRSDLHTPAGYVALKSGGGAAGGVRPFSPREREPMRWDAWTMQADGGTGGRDVVEPGGWLAAYWLARYHGFIDAPTATDPKLLTVATQDSPAVGAKPYVGPPRPAVP